MSGKLNYKNFKFLHSKNNHHKQNSKDKQLEGKWSFMSPKTWCLMYFEKGISLNQYEKINNQTEK